MASTSFPDKLFEDNLFTFSSTSSSTSSLVYNLTDFESDTFSDPNRGWALNVSLIDVEKIQRKLEEMIGNRTIGDKALVFLVVAYVTLIITGATGNGLVCLIMARKPGMRTGRNLFILNLAISDLILCLFTMPFSLVNVSLKYWPLGVVTCKLVAGLQATSIFVSTISITAIALDRYHVIMHPQAPQTQPQPLKAFCTLFSIWASSLLLSFPLFWCQTLVNSSSKVPPLLRKFLPQDQEYCVEEWPVDHGRAFYSVFSMFVQYLLPILIVSVSYLRICNKLKLRMVEKQSQTQREEKRREEEQSFRRTNLLLISIALIFAFSWLPINSLNIVADLFQERLEDPETLRTYLILFSVCHMMGMSSACSNPLLYGWLNTQFHKEFKEMFALCSSSLCCKTEGQNPIQTHIEVHATNQRDKETDLEAQPVPEGDITPCPDTSKLDTVVHLK